MSAAVVLYIDLTSSSCGACNRNADPNEATHAMTSMRGEGCGAEFTAVSSHYTGAELKARVKEMRPDLPWVDFMVGAHE